MGLRLAMPAASSASERSNVATAIAVLRQRFGERLQTGEAIRRQHANTITWIPNQPPDAVIWIETGEEVRQVVDVARTHRVPIIPFGAGTSLEGHINAPRGGLSLDFARMNRVLAVNERDLDSVVEPGVSRKQLNDYLHDMGLFFPVDPGAEEATIGGMAATRASGTTAVRYGTMRENVLGLTVVLPDGRIVRTGGRARKSAAGYDLTRLFVGSEGTLGVITEVTLRLSAIPRAISAAVCSFGTLEGAVGTVIATIRSGVPVARIELLDEVQMEAVNTFSRLDYPVAPTLFFEFHGGSEAGVIEQAEAVQALAVARDGSDFRWATKPEERSRLWRARHDAYYAALALRPGGKGWVTDVCVPVSRLAECITETKKDHAGSALLAPLVGHVGDGNFHLIYVLNPDNPEEMAQARRLNDRLVQRALAMGGTCTGEHGVGYGKMEALIAEHGEGVEVMRRIKSALDPQNLMNPGKMVRL